MTDDEIAPRLYARQIGKTTRSFVRQGDWEMTPDCLTGKIEIEDCGAGGFAVLDDGVHWMAARLDGVKLEGMSDEPGFDAVIARVVVMSILKGAVSYPGNTTATSGK